MTEPPIHTLRIPNPFFEGRNQVYVIRSEPVTLIDSGVATQRAYDALVQGLAQHGLATRDIGLVILTHKHIDHIGNAWRIQRESGAQILIHEADLSSVQQVDPTGQRFLELVQQRLKQWHAPTGDSGNPMNFCWEIEPATATSVVDGQCIPLRNGELEVIHTPGHTIGSICLRFGRNLFSGDHVLPDISSNIGAGDMRHQGLLNHFLQSLARIRDLASYIDEALPGHGEPFPHVEQRCEELLKHHQQRLSQVEAILHQHGPQNVYQLADRLFGELRDFHIMLGCAEAHAHLEFLIAQGRVVVDAELGEFQRT